LNQTQRSTECVGSPC